MSHPYFSPFFFNGLWSPLACMVCRKLPSRRHGFCIFQCSSLNGSGLKPAWSCDIEIFHRSVMFSLVLNLQESIKDFFVPQQIFLILSYFIFFASKLEVTGEAYQCSLLVAKEKVPSGRLLSHCWICLVIYMLTFRCSDRNVETGSFWIAQLKPCWLLMGNIGR